MSSHYLQPQLGAESFSCPHCNVEADQDWFSLFLKPEKGTDVVVLALEAAFNLNSEDLDERESEQLAKRLQENVVTYEYINNPRTVKAKLVNVHASRCYNCNGFAVWVRDQLVFPGRIVETSYTVIQGVRASGDQVQEVAVNDAEEPAAEVEELEGFEEAAAILHNSPRGATALMRICVQKMLPLLNREDTHLDENISNLVRKGLEVEIQQSMDALQIRRQTPFSPAHFDRKKDEETATKLLEFLQGIMGRRMLKYEYEEII